MLIELQDERKEEVDTSPPLSEWSREASLLADLVDAVNALRITFIAANLTKGRTPPKLVPQPRPKTAIERVRAQMDYDRKMASHQRLRARLLPGR